MSAALNIALAALIASTNAELHAGLGADSNSKRQTAANTATLLDLTLSTYAEPADNLRLDLAGALQQHLPSSGALPTELAGGARYRFELDPQLTLRIGAAGHWFRPFAVISRGQIVDAVILPQYGGRARAALALELGATQLQVGFQGELQHTEDPAEPFTQATVRADAAVRYFIDDGLAVRLRYRFSLGAYDGLIPRDPAGGALANAPSMQVAVQGVLLGGQWLSSTGLSARARYELESITDNVEGFLTGVRHRAHANLEYEQANLRLELAADCVARNYPDRTADLRSSLFAGATARAIYWFDWFGISGGYRFEYETAEPVGRLYARHVVTAGPAVRWQDLQSSAGQPMAPSYALLHSETALGTVDRAPVTFAPTSASLSPAFHE